MKIGTPFSWLSMLFWWAGCSHGSTTAQQCEQTSGEWKEVSDCPSACAPPAPTAEACETIEDMSCIMVCSEEATCHCPVDQPFWQEGVGCVGFEACPDESTETGIEGRRAEPLECAIGGDGMRCDLEAG
jgi:hypothetical protein